MEDRSVSRITMD